jgi:hypothetical protein
MRAVRFAKELEPLLAPLELVHPNPRNPNNGDVDVVIESVLRHGFNQVITADRATGEIVAGHTRYAALLALGETRGPLVFSDWQDDKAGPAAYMIVDNESGRMARMDEMQEAKLLMYIRDQEKGLMGTGYDDEKLTRLLTKLAREDEENLGHHFGPPHGEAPLEIFQIVLTFDTPDRRDEVAADLGAIYENVRVVDL